MLNESGIYNQARSAWPRKMLAGQVAKFLANWRNGKYAGKSLEEAWQTKLIEHNAYWSRRFGLMDRQPFAMRKQRQIGSANWQLTGGSLRIELAIANVPKLIMHVPIGESDNLADILHNKLSKVCASYRLIVPKLSSAEASGQLVLFSEPTPEHDWSLWEAELLASMPTELILARRKYNAMLNRYRFTGGSTANSLAQLKANILQYAIRHANSVRDAKQSS